MKDIPMKAKSIIKAVRDTERGHYDRRIAALEGRRYVRKPTCYLNTETGVEYYAIVGSIAFPVGKIPGYAVIVAAVKDAEHVKAPLFEVLYEVENPDLVGLLTECERVRHKWGYPHQLDLWIGDAEHFLQALADFNDRIESKPQDTSEGLYLSPPSDFEDTRRDAIYLQTVKSLLSSEIDGGKRLLIGDNRLLRAHLQNVPSDLKRVEEIPALAALAYACHTLLATTPWLEYTDPHRFEPTIKDGFARFDAWPWEDGTGYDDADHDDGILVSTID